MQVSRKQVYVVLTHVSVWLVYALIHNVLLFYTVSSYGFIKWTLCTYPLVAALFYINAHFIANRFIPRRQYDRLILCSLLLVALYILSRYVVFTYLFPLIGIEIDYSEYRLMFSHFLLDSFWISLQYLLFSYGYWFAYYQINLQREKQALILNMAALEKESMLTKIALLQAQINPHFLFNTLNNIYSVVEEKDAYAAEILLKFGDIMRYSLNDVHVHFVNLQQEIDILNEYIELEQIRYSASSPVQIGFTVCGDAHNLVVPPLLLVTLVENAFKHGPHAIIGASWVRIQLTVDNQQIQFSVGNSKPPLPTVRPTKHKLNIDRVGLANIRRRLELLYPNRHALTIADKPDSYQVTLTLQ